MKMLTSRYALYEVHGDEGELCPGLMIPDDNLFPEGPNRFDPQPKILSGSKEHRGTSVPADGNEGFARS